jgi:succinate dehydrogenase / fumarate reductase cytochrome b subunit
MLWGFLSALVYHLIAGIRHIIMDLGLGESLFVGKITSVGVILFSLIFAVILGIYLW